MKEQLSVSSQKIITPNKTIVGVKKSKPKEIDESSKLPEPTGWRILVLPFKQKEKNKRWFNISRRNSRTITSSIDVWFSFKNGTTLL